MKFIVLELLSNGNEVNGIKVKVINKSKENEDDNFLINDENDTSLYGRELFYFLKRHEFPINNGRLEVICFGLVRLELLIGMYSLVKWINFMGGIRYPYLFENGSGKVEDITNYLINNIKENIVIKDNIITKDKDKIITDKLNLKETINVVKEIKSRKPITKKK